MSNMNEFYEFHGISRTHFAKLVGVAYSTLMGYERGEAIREDNRLRIEIGMQIMEDYALRYHNITRGKGSACDLVFVDENNIIDKNFEKHFNRVILVEL